MCFLSIVIFYSVAMSSSQNVFYIKWTIQTEFSLTKQSRQVYINSLNSSLMRDLAALRADVQLRSNLPLHIVRIFHGVFILNRNILAEKFLFNIKMQFTIYTILQTAFSQNNQFLILDNIM